MGNSVKKSSVKNLYRQQHRVQQPEVRQSAKKPLENDALLFYAKKAVVPRLP